MKLSDIGEFGLIKRLMPLVAAESPDLIVGPEDDAAVWRVGGQLIIATTDTMVDGVHFRSETGGWRDLGWKALAVNVSDVAAMGGTPTNALVTLCLPPELDVAAVDELYAGLMECAGEYGVMVVGGDVVRSQVIAVTVALFGAGTERDGQPALLLRNGAKAGDLIAVTGTLGDSAGGLRRMDDGAGGDDPLVGRHLRPTPRVATGQAAVAAGVRCGLDVSDGLLQDLGHVCEMSGLGAILQADAIPISDELRAAYPDEALGMACAGGEDYELLIVGSKDKIDSLPVTVIGEMVDGAGVRLIDDKGFDRAGWDAFQS